MNQQTSLGKAFEINKKANIYGTFAEIGAGQETVNFFYRAGLASQTVAKSMSAYDMTFSDEIYGKQNRYVCKNRLITMLNHEYHLLEKRLKKKSGDKTCFFVFATTAVTKAKKEKSEFLQNQHAWMGLRFQSQPGEKFNDIIFHVNCLDKSRLQQYEALGILGVNLIYASFYYKNNPQKFIKSLTENLVHSRLEIHGISCSGPALKSLTHSVVNLETLSQKLSSLVFFSNAKNSEFLSDVIFNKTPFIVFGNKALVKEFQKKQSQFCKENRLKKTDTLIIQFTPNSQLKKISSQQCYFPLLVAEDINLKELKKLCAFYTTKPLFFVISEKDFNDKIFCSSYYKKDSLLKNIGDLFNNETKLIIPSKSNTFTDVKGGVILKDYLLNKKQILKI